MRRILHMRIINGKGGGPEKTLLSTPKHLGPDYEVRLAYLRPRHDADYDMAERARESGVTLIDIPESGPLDPRSLMRLSREIRLFRPHVLHAHDYKTDLLAVMFSRWSKAPAVTTLHGFVTMGGRLNLYYRVDRWALRRMHHSIAVSPDLYDFLGQIGVSKDRMTLVENGIDTQVYRRLRDRRQCKRELGFDVDRPLVGAVGPDQTATTVRSGGFSTGFRRQSKYSPGDHQTETDQPSAVRCRDRGPAAGCRNRP